MSAAAPEFDPREHLVRIDLAIAEQAKLSAEARKLTAEQLKLEAERFKLQAEQFKLERDRWLAPLVVMSSAMAAGGALVAGTVALMKVLGP